MEKLEFIRMMLNRRGLSMNDKRRLMALATREIGNTESENTIMSDGRKETIVNNGNLTHAEAKNENNNITRYTSPINLMEFLYRFNQDEILKTTCHEIDSDDMISEINELCGIETYSFEKHANLISERLCNLLDDFEKRKKFLPNRFIGMLMAYVGINDKEWTGLGIKTNWKSAELQVWAQNNQGKVPAPGKNIAKKQKTSGYKLEKGYISNINGNRIISFSGLVIYFKSLFHIRQDNSLGRIIEYQNQNRSDKDCFEIRFKDDFDNRIELLTNVEQLVQAYNAILDICKESHNSEDVHIDLSFYEDQEGKYFAIHDTNSVYGKSLRATCERIGCSQSNLIKNQINGLCDLYIEADFGNKEYARVCLWTKDSKPLGTPHLQISTAPIEPIQGVKYILQFARI